MGPQELHVAVQLRAFLLLAGAFACLFIATPLAPQDVTPLIRMHSSALFYIGLILAGSIAAGTSSLLWLLVFTLVVTSAIGLFYYLRIIVALYSHVEEPLQAIRPLPHGGPLSLTWTLGALTTIVIAIGCYPSPVLRLIQTMIVGSG